MPDALSTPINFLMNTEINSRIWPTSTDDDLRLLDGLFSPTTNTQKYSFANQDHHSSLLNNPNPQQNNNSSQIINLNEEKQLIGPLGSNL